MGNSIIGKMVVMMVWGGVEGRGGGGGLQQHSRPKSVSPSFGCRTKYINPLRAGVPRWSGVFVVGVTSRLEVLHPEASWSRASSALRVRDCWSCALLFFGFCVGKRGKRERESLCVQECGCARGSKRSIPFHSRSV